MLSFGPDLASLDNEFNILLQQAKPWYLALKDKNSKHLCGMWIKKLSEYEARDHQDKERRNSYLSALLSMMRTERFFAPFQMEPTADKLAALPQTLSSNSGKPKGFVPDWITEDFIASTENPMPLATSSCVPWANNSAFTTLSSLSNASFLRDNELDVGDIDSMSTISEEQTSQLISGKCLTTKTVNKFTPTVLSSGDYNADLPLTTKQPPLANTSPRFTNSGLDWLDYSQPSVLPPASFLSDIKQTRQANNNGKSQGDSDDLFTRLQNSEPDGVLEALERRAVSLQAKFHEEMLRQQQQHDADMKQLLVRKNKELDDQKTDFHQKLEEQMQQMSQLEKKLRNANQEISTMKELRERELAEMKRSLSNARELKDVEWEQRLSTLKEDFETEKTRVTRTYEENQRQFMQETQSMVHRIESDFETKRADCERELHRVQESLEILKTQKINLTEKLDALQEENSELAKKLQNSNKTLKEIQQKYTSLEEQYQQNINDHEAEIRAMEEKFVLTLEHIREEKALLTERNKERMDDVNEQMDDLRRVIRTADETKARELALKESEWEESRSLLQRELMKRIHDIEEQKDKEISAIKKEHRTIQQALNEKEEELKHINVELERIKIQSEESIQALRQSLECTSQRKLSDLHHQLEQVMQQRAQDQNALEELRQNHQNALQKRDELWEEEKRRLVSQHEWNIKEIEQRKDKMIKQLKEEHKDNLHTLTRQHEKQLESLEQRVNELEKQLSTSQEAQYEEAQLRQSQLSELGSAREQERINLQRMHREELDRLRLEFEQQKQELLRKHAQEVEQLLRNMKLDMENLQKEMHQEKKMTKNKLQSLTQQLKKLREKHEEKKKLWEEHIRRLAETSSEEKRQLEEMGRQHLENLQMERSIKTSQIQELHTLLDQSRKEYDLALNRAQIEYDMKLHRLLPREIQQDYEETIQSLKAQINSLHQRMSLLQREMTHLTNSGDETISLVMSSNRTGIPHLLNSNADRLSTIHS